MPSLTSRRLILKTAAILPMGVGACGPVARGPAVPVAQTTQANVLGLPNERFFPFSSNADLEQEMVAAIDRQRRTLGLRNYADLPELQLLAVSGGVRTAPLARASCAPGACRERVRPSSG